MHENPLQADSSASSGGPLRLWNELHVAWGLSGHESPGERAQTLATRLSQQQFLLDESSQAGWPIVTSGDFRAAVQDAGRSWRAESLQQALATAVNELAQQYFTIPPAQRRARWVALRHAADFAPELHLRLNHLAAGLDVDAAALQDRDIRVQTLLDELRTTYPLPAAERTTRRAALAREKRKRSKEWANVAKQALRRVESLPDLGRDYLHQLERVPAREQLIRHQDRAVKKQAKLYSAGGRSAGPGIFVWIFLMLLLGAGRVVFQPWRSTSRPAPPRVEPIRLPSGIEINVAPPRAPRPALDSDLERELRTQQAVFNKRQAGIVRQADVPALQQRLGIPPSEPISVGAVEKSHLFRELARQGYAVPEEVQVLNTDQGIYVVLHDADFVALQLWIASHSPDNVEMMKLP